MFASIFIQKSPVEESSDSPGYIVSNQCSVCKHLNKDNPLSCEAFPGGIPMVILMGDFDHTFEFDFADLSDSGVTFSPIDKP